MSQDFLANYKAKHQHPLNRLTHSIGIPMIVISLPLFFFNWRWALLLFVIGWILQFVGHAIEGNQPAFFRNPVYLLVGPLWLLRRAACCTVSSTRPGVSPTARRDFSGVKKPSHRLAGIPLKRNGADDRPVCLPWRTVFPAAAGPVISVDGRRHQPRTGPRSQKSPS